MTDQDLLECAEWFREGMLGGRSSKYMCRAICIPLASLLSFQGRAVNIEETPLDADEWGVLEHMFLVLPDGRVLDPTVDQLVPGPGVYLGPRLPFHGDSPCLAE